MIAMMELSTLLNGALRKLVEPTLNQTTSIAVLLDLAYMMIATGTDKF